MGPPDPVDGTMTRKDELLLLCARIGFNPPA